jgi:carboxymethylenebutenolidase
MRVAHRCKIAVVMTTLLSSLGTRAATAPETVAFPSGDKTLHGLLYKPQGKGPFPAVVYNHGGSPGLISNEAFDAIAPFFTNKGWVFFAPYRRGQGLSSDAGTFIGTQIGDAMKRGTAVAGKRLVHLLSGVQLDDQLAGTRWLEAQSFVLRTQVAVMGNSYGGIETVYGASHHGYCAAVDLTGAAMAWDQLPALRDSLTDAVRHAKAPLLFIQAENDYSTEPSKVLFAAAQAAHRESEIHIFPAFQGAGDGGMQGHSFAWLGASKWFPAAFKFVSKHCTSVAP